MATQNTPAITNSSPESVKKKYTTPVKTPPLELHACMGLNACKGHDVFGTNECAGSGQCATQWHSCHTKNNCRGQGGCGLYGTTEEQCRPGENDCAWQGSCGTPIEAPRFVTQGPNKGSSVWILARKLFEERMEKANRNVRPSPMPYGPTIEFLKTIVTESGTLGYGCGWSGPRSCSYTTEAHKVQRLNKFMVDSAEHDYEEGCKDCDE